MKTGISDEELFFELALQDLTRAADLFAPVHERTAGIDGFVSLELSPLLAYDTKKSVSAAKFLHEKEIVRICSLRFRAQVTACRRSRNRLQTVSLSMSRFFSLASNTLHLQKHICGVWSGACPLGLARMFARSLRSF